MKKFLTFFILVAAVSISACSSSNQQKISDNVEATADKVADEADKTADKTADKAASDVEKAAKDATTVDVFDTLIKSGKHSTLITALETAGLKDTLKKGGPFTIFAPTDDAFKKLNANTLSDYLKPEAKEKLTKLLSLHVVSGERSASSLTTEDIQTLAGERVPVVVDSKTKAVTFGPANVIAADKKASNGIIHYIDAIVIPAN